MELMEGRAAQEPMAAEKMEAGPEIAKFEGLIKDFEVFASYESLLLVITKEEAENSVERERVKVILGPIWALLKEIGLKGNISTEKLEELKAKYNRCSQAVGIINSGKVDHTRVMRNLE